MNWLTTFRNEWFNLHPVLYTLLIILLAIIIGTYVWKSEKAAAERYKRDVWKGPFR